MYHVFESLPPKYQWIALVGLLIATLCVWLIQSRQDAALPPMSAPNSTLSLQFAWSSEGAKAIIDSWTAPQKKIASYQLYSGDGDGGEPRGDPSQERFDWPGRRQVEGNPVLVLFDPASPLCRGGGAAWRVAPRPGRGAPAGGCGGHGGGRRPRTRAAGAAGVGEAGRRRGAVTLESTLDRLAIVFAMPSCAVACCIHPRWRRRRAGGDHKTRMVASGHDGGFAHDAPGLGPRSGSRGEPPHTPGCGREGARHGPWAWAVRCG